METCTYVLWGKKKKTPSQLSLLLQRRHLCFISNGGGGGEAKKIAAHCTFWLFICVPYTSCFLGSFFLSSFLFFATSITEATIYSGFFLPMLNSDVGLENLVILKGWTLSQIMLESSDSLHKYTALSRTPCSNMYTALSWTSCTNILHWVGLLAQI